MGHRVLPDFPEQCKPLTSVIGSGKSNFQPAQYTCLADGRKNRHEEGRCGKGKRQREKLVTEIRIPRTAPFVLVFCQSRSAARKPITMRENLFVSFLIIVWIVVGFSTHIFSTDQTCFLRMITGFLSGG